VEGKMRKLGVRKVTLKTLAASNGLHGIFAPLSKKL
jgi:hypothetical protein